MAGLIEALNLLRAASGNPSFRTLARSAGLKLRPPQALAHTTVRDLFQARRRRLDIDLLMATVRALGLRDPEAARWQRACARAHVEARLGGPPRVLRQLPAATAVFTGRERDLAAVLKPATAAADGDHGANGAVTLAIDGMAGIGKTQLALHAAHELVNSGRFTDTQLYADLWGFDADHAPADPAVVLGTFLSQLGVAAQRIPAALEERAAMFRDQMHDRKALILLDNAAGAEQIRALIPSAPSCLVLVTSRRSLAGLDTAFLHTLDVFRPVESVTLLARIAGTARSRPNRRPPPRSSRPAVPSRSRSPWPLPGCAPGRRGRSPTSPTGCELRGSALSARQAERCVPSSTCPTAGFRPRPSSCSAHWACTRTTSSAPRQPSPRQQPTASEPLRPTRSWSGFRTTIWCGVRPVGAIASTI